MLLKCFGLFGVLAGASVTVRKTSQGPTGYEVTFHYYNATASNITIAGGIQPFTDRDHSNSSGSARYDPHDYQRGWFVSGGGLSSLEKPPYQMTALGDGSWNYTAPLPSGTYSYAYLVDCAPTNSTCYIDINHFVIDPDIPPFINVQGDQIQSTFQVPFDPEFQYVPTMDLNMDYALPVDEVHRGRVYNVNYSSPGSVHPAQDVHDFAVYLPSGYGNEASKKYNVLYLVHGAGGNAQDWQNLAQASNILDRLILEKHIDPTIVVMPSYYNIAPEYKQIKGSITLAVVPPAPVVRENYMQYLIPFVEKVFAVGTDPSQRAIAGFSLGGCLAYEMFINHTDYFNYFGIFSGATLIQGSAGYLNASIVAANPALREKGILTCAGMYDFAFNDTHGLQDALLANAVPFFARVVPFGFHAWNTWQDCLLRFGESVLWKTLPLSAP